MLKIKELSCEVNEITLQQIDLHVQQGDFYIIFGKEEILSKLSPKEKKEIRYVPKGAVLLEYISGKSYLSSIQKSYKTENQEKIEELETYIEKIYKGRYERI